jgi:hypothetical protein
MSSLGVATCHNRGCYEDVKDNSDYCSEKCRRSDAIKTRHDKEILLKKKLLLTKKKEDHGPAPKCFRQGCNNPVHWNNNHWQVYCGRECSILNHNFNYAIQE